MTRMSGFKAVQCQCADGADGSAAEVSNVVMFLLSGMASGITGQNIVVDAGKRFGEVGLMGSQE